MAIIVLKAADFSANNIGKVEIPLEFSTTTKTILGRYGITVNESDSFQREFNKFVNVCESNNIFDSIKGLCLPFMSEVSQNGNLSYAQINALDGTNFFVTDIDGSVTLIDHGLKGIYELYSVQANIKKYSEITYTDLHVSGLLNNTISEDILQPIFYGNTGAILSLANNFLKINITRNLGNDGLKGVLKCANIYNSYANFIAGTTKTEINDFIPYNTNLFNPVTLTYNQKYSNSDIYTCKNSTLLLAFGTHLTNEQSVAYNSAVTNLITAVKTYL